CSRRQHCEDLVLRFYRDLRDFSYPGPHRREGNPLRPLRGKSAPVSLVNQKAAGAFLRNDCYSKFAAVSRLGRTSSPRSARSEYRIGSCSIFPFPLGDARYERRRSAPKSTPVGHLSQSEIAISLSI